MNDKQYSVPFHAVPDLSMPFMDNFLKVSLQQGTDLKTDKLQGCTCMDYKSEAGKWSKYVSLYIYLE